MGTFAYRPRFDLVRYPAAPVAGSEDSWDEGMVGFEARILSNPTVLDVREERKANMERFRTLVGEKGINAEDAYLKLIAKRVSEWNLTAPNAAGEDVPVPAPSESEDSWQGFYVVPIAGLMWLLDVIPNAHHPKALRTLQGLAGTTDESTQTPTSPDQTPPMP